MQNLFFLYTDGLHLQHMEPTTACGHLSMRNPCVNWLQGTASAEVQAVSQAGPAAGGTTAYLNLETGDSHGDMSSVIALVKGGVSRVVIGLLHPLPHLRGQAVRTLKAAGVCVDLLQPALAAQGQAAQQCLQACLKVNEVRVSSEHLVSAPPIYRDACSAA